MKLHERLDLGLHHRVPMVLQAEAAECGLASIAMIVKYFGHNESLADLRRRFGMSLRGATLKNLISVADQLGFATRPQRLELSELEQLRLPCILHWDLNHFVVLTAVKRSGVVIHDPAMGVRRLPLSAVSRHFTGVALELIPTERFMPASAPPRVRASQLLGRTVGLKRSLAQLLVLALAIEVFAIVSPFFLGWVVDHALVSADRDLLLTLALGFLLLFLLRTSVIAMRGWMLMGLDAALKVQSRANLFTHLLNLPAAYFEARHLGDVMSRFGSQEDMLKAITSDLVEAILDGLMAIVTLAIMFVLAPDLALIVLGGAVLYGLIRWISYSPLRQASAEAIVWAARRDSHFLETMRGIRAIKLFNGQEDRRIHWLNLLVETMNRQLATDKLRLLFRTSNNLLLGVLSIVIVWLGAHRVLSGAFSVGLLLAFIAYKDEFLRRISELINKGVDLAMLRLHAERLADIALTAPEARGVRSLSPDVEHRPASIELHNVSFRYSEHEPWVLSNVSLRIEAGEAVAIAGPSGGGKSTLLKLLAGLLQPTHGEIFVDGEPISRFGLDSHRARIGVVMQDDQLFAGSISDNISFFAEQSDRELIEQSAKLAAVHDDIVSMPMGYSTLIGDMGTVLSGGQKQRVVLARALYRRPGILLLDEATSHLDVEREAAVNNALRCIGVTRVIVAHRPETIRSSDRVVHLIKGEIANPRDGGKLEHGETALQVHSSAT